VGTSALEFGLGTIAETAITAGGEWDSGEAAGSKFTSDLTDLDDAGAADANAMPATEAADDGLLIGCDADKGAPVGLRVTTSTAGTVGTMAWQYLAKNGTYKNFPTIIDGTTQWTATAGALIVQWEVPDDFVPMVEDEVDSTARYYIKADVLTVYTVNPVISQLKVYQPDSGAGVSAGVAAPLTGRITAVSYAGTAGATNNDIILQIINFTRNTRGVVTLTGNPAIGRFALSTALYVEQGDEIGIMATQLDGTTEITNLTGFSLEVSI
jgi:hypothetical protein